MVLQCLLFRILNPGQVVTDSLCCGITLSGLLQVLLSTEQTNRWHASGCTAGNMRVLLEADR